MRVLVLVLSCRRAPYPEMIDAVRATWAADAHPGIEIAFYYGRSPDLPDPGDDRWFAQGDTIVCGCEDADPTQIGRKTVIAFEAALNTRRFDYLYRVNCSSYVDQAKLVAWLRGRPRRGYYAGPTGRYPNTAESEARHGDRPPIRFASGSGFLLSRDLVETVVHEKQRYKAYEQQGLADDVALGKLLTEDHGLSIDEPHPFVNYRFGASAEHVRREPEGAFHYSFSSSRPADMRVFHRGGGSVAREAETIYSVVCTDAHPGAQWQCELLEHSWRRAGQPGELIRLFAAEEHEPLPVQRHARVLRTQPANVHPESGDHYPPYNRLYSLQAWLEREQPRGTVVLLDCDFVFRAPIARPASPNEPAAQEWYAFYLSAELRAIVEELAPGTADRVQPVTWPTRIHSEDLARLMPRWIERTGQLRARVGGWESDMLAFAVASAELDIHYQLESLAAWIDWPEDFTAGASIIHYCRPVESEDGRRLWYKWDYAPWEPLNVDPEEAKLDYCRELLTMLDEYAALRRGYPLPE